MHVRGVCAILATLGAILRPALAQHFTRQWVLHVPGGRSIAEQVAADHGFEHLGEIFEDYYHVSHPRIVRRAASAHPGKRVQLAADTRVAWAQQQRVKRRAKRDYRDMAFSDPRWSNMWYLNRGAGLDMNVIPAWQEGITGRGAVVTILDDGLEKDHPDLIQNYDPMASYDVNNQDSDPSPRYDMIDSNRHGTRCAGEVAATGNNSICSLGVAHGAQVGGVRMLDGDVTDAVEARSLSLNPQHIDIYSASWGPDDDGKTVDGPGELATRAFVEGVTKGRDGKGSIFVWASGNGGRDHDNCNCDGYTNSIYSLSISSATEHGRVPWYSEACSSTLATTYSSGEVGERQVVTTDLHHACTSSHTGTSASAPLAAGICALALEANPKLTWRDMQHIVVRTARPQRLVAHDWQTNGVGRNVSHSFGYGLMDAHAMVRLARKWISVPEQHSHEVKAPQADKKIPPRSVVVLQLAVTDAGAVKVLEHIQAKLTITSHKRGDLNIQLISPMGTRVTLLAHRIHDLSRNGFTHWPFMSVHSWGESPIGTWTLEVHNDGRLLGRATLQSWSLVLYGINQTNPNDLDPPSFAKANRKLNSARVDSTTVAGTHGGATTASSKDRKKNKKQKAKAKPKSKATAKPADAAKSKKPDLLPFYYAVNASKFSKYAKNYSITYPIMIPEREFEKFTGGANIDEQHRKKMQKQKEKSRDLNSNRNSEARGAGTVAPSTTTARVRTPPSRNKSAEITAWDLVMYGTSTPPAAQDSVLKDLPTATKAPTYTHTDDINDNVIDADDEGQNAGPEIRKDVLDEEEFAQQAMSGCKQSRAGVCIVCMEGFYFFDNACVDRCPIGFYVVKYTEYNYDPAEAPAILACEPCHYSCKACNASNDYACTECFPDAFLHERTATEHYCYPSMVKTTLREEVWCWRVFVTLIVLIILGLVSGAVFGYRRRNVKHSHPLDNKFMKMDSLQHIRDIERRVKSAVYSDSE